MASSSGSSSSSSSSSSTKNIYENKKTSYKESTNASVIDPAAIAKTRKNMRQTNDATLKNSKDKNSSSSSSIERGGGGRSGEKMFWVITSVFASTHKAAISDNFFTFRDAIKRQGAQLCVTQIAYDNSSYLLGDDDADIVKSFRGSREMHLMWQKERLLNQALDLLPKTAKYVAWVGYLDNNVILHLFHGKRKDRFYLKREKVLMDMKFNSKRHLVKDPKLSLVANNNKSKHGPYDDLHHRHHHSAKLDQYRKEGGIWSWKGSPKFVRSVVRKFERYFQIKEHGIAENGATQLL
eukprot:jgi/Bigna1/126202/aug1.2_g910